MLFPISKSTRTGKNRSNPFAATLAGPLESKDTLEQYAFRFGRSYDSYLVTNSGRHQFWANNGAGVVAYVRSGKYLHVGGGLLAAAKHKAQLLAEFADFARRRDWFISFYNIADDDVGLFRRFGFQVTKWGEDAIIDLTNRTWAGKEFQWVRRQTSYCRRKGLVFSECHEAQFCTAQWDEVANELLEISAARLAARPQAKEMGFLDGRFDPEVVGRKRIFLCRSTDRIEGFVICNPCLNGAEWALDVFRQRPDAPRGTVAFLIHQTLELLKTEQIDRASLCLVPALGCQDRLPGDSRLIRWGLNLSRHFNVVFDLAGLYHFKSRFRPRFENRYVCSLPRTTIGSVWTFTRLSGALNVSPHKLLRVARAHWQKRARRLTLAA